MPVYIFLLQGIGEFKTALQRQVVTVQNIGLFNKELVFWGWK